MPMQISCPRDGGWVAGDPISEAGSLGTSPSPKKSNLRRLASLTLAVAATMTSCGIAVFAAWERGGTIAEQLAYSAFAGVVVSGVHLLPMLSRGQSLAARIIVSVVCVAGLVSTLSGQVAFYEFAQRDAGARRAESVPDSVTAPLTADPPTRGLTAIARDQAAERTKLALIDNHRCGSTCADARLRRATVIATLDELQTEADEAKRRELLADRRAALDDRTIRQRDAMRADPVAAQLAALTGIDEDRVMLLLDLIYAAVLDGIGVLGWYLALSGRLYDGRPAYATTVAIGNGMGSDPVATEVGSDADGPAARSTVLSGADAELAQFMRDVADGKVKPTVAGIRNYLGCSQQKAAKLRRELAVLGVVIDRRSGDRDVC
ncbi:hypothetical protein NDK50_00905 [Paraburkholderia bryophila]|uniref:hypothetical protein n=1 Tax=Paraburkholderia bryophila TaxID=420952 RepID=UPI00234A815B|nr:hypothetical protein [Paraburkholderia bryophila]WCM20072.1 hypothetical protein NDK50_00905 [Paraburkholderia bryophila]